ncbi:uncharacterized protein LOC116844857 [Odontomachus brunneus]|uniref:uncharacterized protein LOC116844857 n=1 Tax=Odontomachus brunneus TaxID=486640 RepID=UPI0013F18954|nr:uncharacterized protein LOC116844857 [Odontomachus brunneus]
MVKIFSKTSSTCMQLYHKNFDPLTRYDQRMPPYNPLPTTITSVHECPVSKLQIEYFTPQQNHERRKYIKVKTSVTRDQLLKSSKLNYFQSNRNNGSVRWYLEDEIALAKDIFWVEKQRIYNEMIDRAIKIAKKKQKSYMSYLKCPRWYQDFSPKQMRNLMNLTNIMRIDYEETVTSGTQTILIAIGIISTFFKLMPNIIRQLHISCNLDSVYFLQEVYKILTGIDFQNEGYKKFYDCNERIILSAIAFLTLPETVMELHRRLPEVIIPRLLKPRSPIYLIRRKSRCPYKEELFKCPDWASYRNDLQRWRKEYKLFPIPKVILPLKKYRKSFINNKVPSEFNKKEGENIYAKHLEEINMKKVFDQQDRRNIDKQTGYKYGNSTSKENLYTKKSETFAIQLPDENKKFDFTITGLSEKSAMVEYKICGMLKPPRAGRKSLLGGKEPHYIIAGASEDPPSCSVTYEITGVADVTPTNSDERFFAVLKLGDGPRKIFPSGREHLSRKWQEWLFNIDEEFKRLQKEANELIKSVRATTRIVFPEPVCDSCCSCRQTAKTREKLRQTKTPYLLIDNVMKDKDEIKYIVGSMVLHSPAPSLTGSEVNLLEMVASQDEIKTNIIVNGVTNENGKTQYYISGVQKEKIHVPSRIPDALSLQTISLQSRNVPSCACVIRQIFNKDVNFSASKDDIPWTNDEGLCMGKKYRPNESGAYSCKMYPGDESCKRNPFKKLMKIKEQEEGKGEERTELTEVEKPIQALEKKTPEKKDKFIPDPNYPAYDDPWNIARTAPSAKELVTDYEKSLKLTPRSLPAVSSSLKTQDRQKDTFLSNKLKKFDKEIDQEVSSKVSSKSSKMPVKGVQEKKTRGKQHTEKMNKKQKNVQVPSKKITANARSVRLLNEVSKFSSMNKTEKKRLILIQADELAKQSNKVHKTRKDVFVKRNRKKIITNGTDQIDDRKQEMERLKTMMKTYTEILGDVQPAILPWEQPSTIGPREKFDDTSIDEEENRRISKEPCGWRTKSEQELPAKKTLVYLCEPDYPLETVAVRPGGRPCRCRENRNKKKILMYNVSGLVDEKKDGRRVKKAGGRTKLKVENRIIDGVTYFTPPISPRRSDEYIPEYELLESPYDICVGEATKSSKLLDKHFDSKNMIEKIRKSEPCNCSNRIDKISITKESDIQKKEIEEARQKLMESKSPEEKVKMALKDAALMEYFTQPKYDASCRISYRKNKKRVKPLRLQMVKPVCECKYERKIVERNEEKAKWKARQQKLKTLKKQPFMHIVDTSRPMVPDTKFIISDVKRIPLENDYGDEVKYCITGVAENLTMSSSQRIVDGLKMCTPVVTPEPSKEDLRRDTPHRHWSPMDIPPGPLPRKDAALKEEMERRKKVRDEAFRIIYGEDKQDVSRLAYHDCPETCLKKSMDVVENNSELEKIDTSVKMQVPKTQMRSHLLSAKKTNGKMRRRRNVSPNNVLVSRENLKHSEKAASEGGQQDASYKQTIEKTEKKNDDDIPRVNNDGDRKYLSDKLDLMTIIKAELKKMATEGYIFAKLPECYLMPQLQDWVMYRKGVAFSETDKKALMRHTLFIWRQLDTMPQPKIELPSLHMTPHQLRELTYDRAEEMKKKIEKKMATFYSKIHKSRVFYARSSWGSMEFGKFPSTWFKRAFFTYMASREADGHIYKL